VAFSCLVPDPQGDVVPSPRHFVQLGVVSAQLRGYSSSFQSASISSESDNSSDVPSLESYPSPAVDSGVSFYPAQLSPCTDQSFQDFEEALSSSGQEAALYPFGSEEGVEVSGGEFVEEGAAVV
jgi:hypothetical protein